MMLKRGTNTPSKYLLRPGARYAAKLKQYGIGYLGNDPNADFTIWQLAVGSDKEVRSIADFFGLRYKTDQNDKTQINHSLITAVISRREGDKNIHGK